MDKDKPKIIRKADVLKKLNNESLYLIERGLLGELPDKLKPPIVPVRGHSNELVARPSTLLSACLPVIADSPEILTPSDEESVSPLKKSFSFRDKLSRISFFGKDKEKPKWKTIVEDERNLDERPKEDPPELRREKTDNDLKSNKRFWFFRNKEMDKKATDSPIYQRSKSFEFLPRAIEEQDNQKSKEKSVLKNSNSYVFGSSDTMGDAWTSNESLEYISNVYYDNEDGVFLKSIREFPSESSNNNSSISTATSGSSAYVETIFKRESVADLLDEFNKAVELFSETYLSDSEPYTKTNKMTVQEKRKSSSFTTLPSPRILQVNKVSEISEDFKNELSKVLSDRGSVVPGERTNRRGSVTDWFVLEDKTAEANRASEGTRLNEANKYRRGQKKVINRVRRMSSTKYWITPEECAIYTRDQRPPLVIPRITQYRQPRRDQRITQPYPEDSSDLSLQARNERQNWNSNLGRNRVELERNFSKNASESPPFIRINKNLSGSTENLLISNVRRPNFLQIPASSSGDSLDIEIRDREVSHARSRKSRSMVAPNKRINKSPVPAPRLALQQNPEALVILEGPVKRTKFFEGRKKMKKSWTDCYMILIQTALVFYKDQRTYNATKVFKPPGTPPSPAAPRAELVLPLRDARIRQCIAMHTRRHNRSLVLIVDYDQYLVQDETEEGARKWLQAIQRVIYSLYPTADYDCPTPSNQSSTDLDSLGRTPPTSRHNRNKQKVGGSSNEDLSDSTETSIQKTHVKSRLRKFFAKRPAMEVLVKKGIYKDEPVFGRNLAEVCPQTSPQVPEFVVACVNEIESSDENLCTDGLYRASGNLSQVQKIRLEIDQNNTSVISKNSDIHVLTGSLKLFFRELKEPLIPYSLFHRVLAACSIKPREAKIKEFREIIQALPQCNRDTLKFLLEHLLRVQQYSEKNRMHIANLAIVFGPTILWAPVTAKARNIAVDCIQQNNVVDILLNEFNEIFSEENKTKKKA
uniref:Rho GTPase-activating protein 15 n=2 Tax=Bombyx mori TaxID=7091 RepID=A0A8R2M2F8_BOMMO|nr:uncharacterized protein LOC101743410 isoform X1 [Bombyx mori]